MTTSQNFVDLNPRWQLAAAVGLGVAAVHLSPFVASGEEQTDVMASASPLAIHDGYNEDLVLAGFSSKMSKFFDSVRRSIKKVSREMTRCFQVNRSRSHGTSKNNQGQLVAPGTTTSRTGPLPRLSKVLQIDSSKLRAVDKLDLHSDWDAAILGKGRHVTFNNLSTSTKAMMKLCALNPKFIFEDSQKIDLPRDYKKNTADYKDALNNLHIFGQSTSKVCHPVDRSQPTAFYHPLHAFTLLSLTALGARKPGPAIDHNFHNLTNPNKAVALTNYFNQFAKDMSFGYDQQVAVAMATGDDLLTPPRKGHIPLKKMSFVDSLMQPQKGIYVDFANKILGSTWLSGGEVQEESLFYEHPDLALWHITKPTLGLREGAMMTGIRRHSSIDIGDRFNKIGQVSSLTDNQPKSVIAIDAPNRNGGVASEAVLTGHLLSKLDAACKLAAKQGEPLVTGPLGCGAFGGNILHTMLATLYAATKNDVEVIFCIPGNQTKVAEFDAHVAKLQNFTLNDLHRVFDDIVNNKTDVDDALAKLLTQRSGIQSVKTRVSGTHKTFKTRASMRRYTNLI